MYVGKQKTKKNAWIEVITKVVAATFLDYFLFIHLFIGLFIYVYLQDFFINLA